MDYGIEHAGKVYTPNGTIAIDPAANEERNRAIEATELAHWAGRPDRAIAYYSFPAEELPLFGRPRVWRQTFAPCLHTYINATKPGDPGTDHHAIVSTWRGTVLGRIVSARVYRHNFGARFVSLRVKASNGASYYGRASWDGGDAIILRKVRS